MVTASNARNSPSSVMAGRCAQRTWHARGGEQDRRGRKVMEERADPRLSVQHMQADRESERHDQGPAAELHEPQYAQHERAQDLDAAEHAQDGAHP